MRNSLFLFGFIILLLASCQEDQKRTISQRIDKSKLKEKLIQTNKSLVKNEDQNIKDFIARYKYQMKETGSGLFYEIYKKGRGVKTYKGATVELNYTVRLLNGEIVYSSDEDGFKKFKIGKGGVESGLEEGILLLHVGDHVRFIIPSHLAFGLLGDSEKIREKATIVYDIELINIK